MFHLRPVEKGFIMQAMIVRINMMTTEIFFEGQRVIQSLQQLILTRLSVLIRGFFEDFAIEVGHKIYRLNQLILVSLQT